MILDAIMQYFFVIWPLMGSLVNVLWASGIFWNVRWQLVVQESAQPPRQALLNEQCSSPQRGLRMCHASQLKHGLKLTPKWQTEQVSSALASSYNSTTLPWRAITHSRAKTTLALLLRHYRRRMTDFSAKKEITYFKRRRKQTYWIFLWE